MNNSKAISAAMTDSQRGQLIALAENPGTAARLLSCLDRNQKAARVLWDVYCIALVTIGASPGEATL